MWSWAAKWGLRIIASWKMARLRGHRREFLRAKRFAGAKRSGEPPRARLANLRRRMLGMRACRNWRRASKNWKRRRKRIHRGRRGEQEENSNAVAGDCCRRAYAQHREDAIGVRLDFGLPRERLDRGQNHAVWPWSVRAEWRKLRLRSGGACLRDQ